MASYPTRKHRRGAKLPQPPRRFAPHPAFGEVPDIQRQPARIPKPAPGKARRYFAPKTPPRYYPLAPKRIPRFGGALGVGMLGLGLVEYYTRKRVPDGFDHPIYDSNKWRFYLRHGPNTYPAPYDGGYTGWAGGYTRDGESGPETGRIAGQARTLRAFPAVFETNGPFGYWIPNYGTTMRYASWGTFTAHQIDRGRNPNPQITAEGTIRAELLKPHPEPVPAALNHPAKFPQPSPFDVLPGQFAPFPRAVPSPSWPKPAMPKPLAAQQLQPKWETAPKADTPPNARPAEIISTGPGGVKYIPNGLHFLSPPGKGEKEPPKRRDVKRAFKLGDLAGTATELVDIHDAAYDATPIPNHRKTWYRGKDVTGAKKRMALVWEYADEMDVSEFVLNLFVQHQQDKIGGQLGQQMEKSLGKNRFRGVSRFSRILG